MLPAASGVALWFAAAALPVQDLLDHVPQAQRELLLNEDFFVCDGDIEKKEAEDEEDEGIEEDEENEED